jgi:hypothetical protein
MGTGGGDTWKAMWRDCGGTTHLCVILAGSAGYAHAVEMATGRTIGFAFLGTLLGGALGAGLGIAGGLLWTSLAGTSGFEGYSGFVVAYWMLAGILVGLFAGLVAGIRLARRPA